GAGDGAAGTGPRLAGALGTKVERILVADDNADMRDYLHRLLSPEYAVTTVADGQAALEHVLEERPDLVLTDVMMPRLDGFGLLAALRAGESTRSLPVIMLSARAGEEARIEGVHAGADAYVIKPFSARELLARVASQLELTRLRTSVEQELRSRSEQFVTLFNQAPLGVYLVDCEFRIREVNPIALPVFGDIPGGIIGRDFDAIIHRLWEKPYADEIVRIVRHTLETGESYIEPERGEKRLDRGVTEYYEWRLDRIALPDGTHGVVCYFRDVAAQVQARKLIEESKAALEAADRRKNEFLATLAHELRNPLAAIGNSVNVLRHAAAAAGFAEIHPIFERQVKHLVRLVDDLMDVSRITSGKIELRKEPIGLGTVVRSAIETAAPLIEKRGQRLELSLPDEHIAVDADPVRLSQVFANLLNNASKYSPDGGPVGLDVRRDDSSAVVSVRDRGIGIPPEMLPTVFDLFMQVDHSYSRARGGLGIGLTLARDLVRMHGGSIEAKSEGAGTGSEFVVTLPLSDVAGISSQAPPREEAHEPRIGQRILIVEDDADAAESLRLLLSMTGADVRTARGGAAGLELLDAYRPAVVILDIGMPGMDGLELARRIRATTDGSKLTLVALSGWGQEEDRRRSREAGIDHHLVKPVDVDTLERLLAGVASPSPMRPPAALPQEERVSAVAGQ
ncbi:MAG TPA: response regulator, partial [Casimicrobiaceae bacterium]|nr:response regulator [Casimicrobiaceae bacterium]